MIHILLAVLAGILTVASPCILPILPIILGVSVGHTSKTRPLYIVAGFVLVFSLAAILLSRLAQHTGLGADTVRTVGVVVLALFGVLLVWPRPFDALMARLTPYLTRVSAAGGTGRGAWGAFVLGMTLGVVWTPCAGPVLGSVLTLVALQKEFLTAVILLFAYALGAGIPMLIIAYAGQYVSTSIASVARYAAALQRAFGVIIILLAIALYKQYDVQIYTKLLEHFPSFNPKF